MNEKILQEMQPILDRFAEEPTIKSRFIDLVGFLLRTESYFNQKFDKEMEVNRLLLRTIKNLANNYSHAELNDAIAGFDRSQHEFQILQRAMDWRLNIVNQGSRST